VKRVPDRRTIVVLSSLVGAMTLASTVLLLLEPTQVAPFNGVRLQSIDRGTSPQDVLFATQPAIHPQRWDKIVIHDSGTLLGSAASLNREHERLGRSGLGYHFVIGNGSDTNDGLIEVGFRWRTQKIGAHSLGPDAATFNRSGIGICLVGDADRKPITDAQMRELVWLVQQLQEKFNIPAHEVYLGIGSGQAPLPNGHFPLGTFRRELLNVAAR